MKHLAQNRSKSKAARIRLPQDTIRSKTGTGKRHRSRWLVRYGCFRRQSDGSVLSGVDDPWVHPVCHLKYKPPRISGTTKKANQRYRKLFGKQSLIEEDRCEYRYILEIVLNPQ